MSLGRWVYMDDAFVQSDAARVSPFDRAYLFAHAAYEVTAVYNGKLIDWDGHVARLNRTLAGIEILVPDLDLKSLHEELIARNDLSEGLIYLQVSAGCHGPRDFVGPEDLIPSVFLFSSARALIGATAREGVSAVTTEDTRWTRRDMKTTQLLSQSLAYRAARRVGAFTAIMHEDGLVTEAASANVWIVRPDQTVQTRELSPALLPGITRDRVASLARNDGCTVLEAAFSLDEMREAPEVFTTSTGAVIVPVISIDGQAIGAGKPGPTTRRIQRLYYQHIGADVPAVAPWTEA
ncbi:MAG: aminotransferase class IV [Pseudomonadota bacterium]